VQRIYRLQLRRQTGKEAKRQMSKGTEVITQRKERRSRKYPDKQAAKARRKAGRKLAGQRKQATLRAKYGQAGRPAPVVVKNLAELSPLDRARYGERS
jgi:hypothetical protein